MIKNQLSTSHILTDDHYKAIGKIAVEWSYVESDIETAIWFLVGLGRNRESIRTAYAITAHLGSETRLDILKTLVHNKTGNSLTYKDLCTFLGKVQTLRGMRNEIIHGLYYPASGSTDTAASYKVKAKGQLKFTFAKRTVAELNSIVQQIVDLRAEWFSVVRHTLP